MTREGREKGERILFQEIHLAINKKNNNIV